MAQAQMRRLWNMPCPLPGPTQELSQLATFGRGRAHLFSNEESTKDRLKDCWYLAVTNEIHYSRQRDPPSIALVHSQGDCVDDGEAPDTWNDIDGVASLRDRLFLQEHEEQLFRQVVAVVRDRGTSLGDFKIKPDHHVKNFRALKSNGTDRQIELTFRYSLGTDGRYVVAPGTVQFAQGSKNNAQAIVNAAAAASASFYSASASTASAGAAPGTRAPSSRHSQSSGSALAGHQASRSLQNQPPASNASGWQKSQQWPNRK